ncbi:Stk1 family PASTA domain-containing Ser/Thr kinase [Clostridium intestinale]|uniref:Stk1 family PASTA domain-containing Ser/Thr kinase n=1 Tax=Clostridium intestinale TaxID=36845 RepID=UPI002DD64F82|nr:Stk1 family PASTA domain-containing Ser/Thr kinase [Clostridium intestinale]WRY53074.1 Stk1 family PASTA domain-containing Ser/Thr kinase [Clostridium intestinale]
MENIILGDRYELQEKIGEGGMSLVYKARDKKLNRFIAVKILKHEFIDNEDIVDKFKKEATAIANLNDPYIVNVLDVGSQEDYNYIVMEYVKGKTLKEFIREKGRISYDLALNFSTQIAKALDCAHKNNIIHRDIKPQNILVTEEGSLKVTDFGIAKSTNSSTITNTSNVIGSAHYFSPEQAKGNYIDSRTDLYSLGVVIYEMVTGRVPFDADSPVSVALKHIQEEVVPPKNINSAVPESLNKLILKAMEKEQIKRYQSAKEMIVDLDKIKNDPNAIIGTVPVTEDDFTRVMPSVNPANVAAVKNSTSKSNDDWEEDEDDWDEEEDDSKKKKNKTKLGIILALVAVLILAGAAITTYFLTTNNKKAEDLKMPKVIGLKQDDAEKTLKDMGLEMLVAGEEKSTEPAGTVVKANKNEGDTVKKGETIRVYVSGKETKKKLQDVTGLDENQAIAFLGNAGLEVSVNREYSDSVEKGKVIKQDPKGDTEITEDTKVTLTVSQGKKPVTVPKLLGLSKQEAINALNAVGLNGDSKEAETTDKNKDGKVIDSSVKEGNTADAGSTITLTIGRYKDDNPDIELGFLVGKTVQEAADYMESKGINPDPDGIGDVVVSLSKPKAKKGETIKITSKKSDVKPPATS